ncbi:MAG: putative Na+/H+ antiporter [Oligoflexus sp.]
MSSDHSGLRRIFFLFSLFIVTLFTFGENSPAFAAGMEPLPTDAAALPFPVPLDSYDDQHLDLGQRLQYRVQVEPFNLVALIIFICAILHTFFAGKINALAHKVQHRFEEKHAAAGMAESPHGEVSILGKLLHFLGEIEAIFGIWVIALVIAIISFHDWHTALHYVNDTVNYTEPMFIVVIMTIAATRPVLNLAENLLKFFAGLGKGSVAAWWFTILTLAPIFGSFITEPAAMTIAALLLSKQFYRLQPSNSFKYATLGLLFVNVSVGGTLTNFAAPPVLMVAGPWDWSSFFMLTQFGWKACVGIFLSSFIYFLVFRREFVRLEAYRIEQKRSAVEVVGESENNRVPHWVTLVHVAFLVWTVMNAHYPALFIGGFLFFLGFKEMTPQFQNRLELKTAILVGFFLAGLVNHGGVQGWWISPVLASLGEIPLMLMATGLTAFNDNAAITYLSTLVEGLTLELKYAVVVGAVTGGGLTVIANAPNPAGQAILARFFTNRAVNPLHLAIGAIVPTVLVGILFMIL